MPQIDAQDIDWDQVTGLARAGQYDQYIAATLSPRAARGDLILLAAFAGEINRILHSVTEPTIAAIRLQWWRDALSDLGDTSSGSPLADGLRGMIVRRNLPVALLIGHIDAQELELHPDLPEDQETLAQHFIKRDGGPFNLAARILGDPMTGATQQTIARAAGAYGLARTLAESRLRQNYRQLLVPHDRLREHDIDVSSLPGAAAELLADLVEEQCKVAQESLIATRRAYSALTSDAKSALLPLSVTELYIRSARRQRDAPNPSETEPSQFVRSWRMLMAYWRGRI